MRDFDPTKYLPAYVSDLINERSNNPMYANNNELLTTVQDSIGRDQIYKKISGIVDKIKFSSVEHEANSLAKGLKEGIQKIEDGEWSAGWINSQKISSKINQKVVDPNTGETVTDPNVQRAFMQIYGSLSDKEKTLLLLVGKEQNMSVQDVIFNSILTQSEQVTKVTDDRFRLGQTARGGKKVLEQVLVQVGVTLLILCRQHKAIWYLEILENESKVL